MYHLSPLRKVLHGLHTHTYMSMSSASSAVGDGNNAAPPPPSTSSLGALKQQMELLQVTLQKEITKLDTNWSNYEERKNGVDLIQSRVVQSCIPENKRLRLNVGGKKFEIGDTHTRNNNYFRRIAAEGPASADDDGFYFENRNPQFIHVVMQFLRAGHVRLGKYTRRELDKIREDAEFYMVQGLVHDVDQHILLTKSAVGEKRVLSLNTEAGRGLPTTYVNGIFFEVLVPQTIGLHSISFVAGENNRKLVCDVMYKEGSMDGPAGQLKRVGTVEKQVEKGKLVSISISDSLTLLPGAHTIGVFSATSSNAVGVCELGKSVRGTPILSVVKSYHCTNPKQFTQRAGENMLDFCGELSFTVQ